MTISLVPDSQDELAAYQMSIEQFKRHFNHEETCLLALYKAKWPNGYRCPRCSFTRCYTIRRRRLPIYECSSCGHQTSLTVNTILEKSRTPLTLWFQAIYLHTQIPGISASNLMHLIGTTYKTAWLISHKIRHAMTQSDSGMRLSGLVKINCAQYGRPYNPTVYRHPQEHPLLVGAILSHEGTLTYLKIKQVPNEHLVEDRVTPLGRDAFIYDHVDSKKSVITSNILKFSPMRDRQLLSVAKHASLWINGTYCGIGAKHLQAYLDHYCYLRNQNSPFSVHLGRCATTSVCTYKMLTSKPPDGVVPRPITVIYPQLLKMESFRFQAN